MNEPKDAGDEIRVAGVSMIEERPRG